MDLGTAAATAPTPHGPADEKHTPDPPPLRDGAAIALGALAVYLLAGRLAFHGGDVYQLLWGSYTDQLRHHLYCFFYMPLLNGGRALLEPLGASPYRTGLVLSASGMAAGVFLAHTASRVLGADRGTAAFAALLAATTPPVVYFATVTEVHGTALMFCGVAWIAIAAWARARTPRRAAMVGLALLLAYLAHPTAGAMGTAMLPAAILARGGDRPLDRAFWLGFARDAAIALAILVVGVLTVPDLLQMAGARTSTDFQEHFLQKRARVNAHAHRIPRTLWRDWLMPYLPVSATLLALLAVPRARAAALAAVLACVPFHAISWLLFYDAETEYGAYTTAMVWPTAIVVAVFCRARWLRTLMVLAAVAVSAHLWSRLGELPHSRDTAAAVRTATGGREAIWIVGNHLDAQAILTRSVPMEVVSLPELLILHPAATDILPRIDAFVARLAADGKPAVVTSNAFDQLRELAPAYPGARAMLEWLEARRGRELGRAGEAVCYAFEPRR